MLILLNFYFLRILTSPYSIPNMPKLLGIRKKIKKRKNILERISKFVGIKILVIKFHFEPILVYQFNPVNLSLILSLSAHSKLFPGILESLFMYRSRFKSNHT